MKALSETEVKTEVEESPKTEEAETSLVWGDHRLPHEGAGEAVKRQEFRIERSHNHKITADGHTSIVGAATNSKILRILIVVPPDDFARSGIDGNESVVGRRHVHDAVIDDG